MNLVSFVSLACYVTDIIYIFIFVCSVNFVIFFFNYVNWEDFKKKQNL